VFLNIHICHVSETRTYINLHTRFTVTLMTSCTLQKSSKMAFHNPPIYKFSYHLDWLPFQACKFFLFQKCLHRCDFDGGSRSVRRKKKFSIRQGTRHIYVTAVCWNLLQENVCMYHGPLYYRPGHATERRRTLSLWT
jgi:hypothetical protein